MFLVFGCCSVRVFSVVPLGLALGFLCFDVFLLTRATLFALTFVFCALLSIPVQLIIWKDSPPKQSIICRVVCYIVTLFIDLL